MARNGEATERHPSVPWRDITRLRIVLAHHYHRVDPDQVRVIAAESGDPTGTGLPSLGARFVWEGCRGLASSG